MMQIIKGKKKTRGIGRCNICNMIDNFVNAPALKISWVGYVLIALSGDGDERERKGGKEEGKEEERRKKEKREKKKKKKKCREE